MSNSLLILAADTSSPRSSFAIARDEQILASLSSDSTVPHSRTFFGNISTLLQLAGLKVTEIDAFAAATGPGSFTGLRVGLAAIKGLAYTHGKRSVGIDSLDAAALSAGIAGMVMVMIGAGRDEVYCGLRDVGADGMVRAIEGDLVGSPELIVDRMNENSKAGPIVIVGDGALKYRTLLEEIATDFVTVSHVLTASQSWQLKIDNQETAVVIARYSARLLKRGIEPEAIPYYIRPSDAEIKLFGS
jgi:tRNA threonylcarbamoyladenosine biosynthesis protein TsaB